MAKAHNPATIIQSALICSPRAVASTATAPAPRTPIATQSNFFQKFIVSLDRLPLPLPLNLLPWLDNENADAEVVEEEELVSHYYIKASLRATVLDSGIP